MFMSGLYDNMKERNEKKDRCVPYFVSVFVMYGMVLVWHVHSTRSFEERKKERKKERINGRFWKREVVSGLCWWTVTVTVSYVCMGFWLLGGCGGGGGGEWGWWILVCVCVCVNVYVCM